MQQLFKCLLATFLTLILTGNSIINAQVTVYLGKQSIVPEDYFGYNGSSVINADGPAYDTQWFMDSLTNLSPSVVRYPAGLIGNYWDWQIGHFIKDLPQNTVLPKYFYNLDTRNLDLYTLKNLCERVGVNPIINLNLLTSDHFYQTAGLMFANSINLPVKYVEFGNEFYLDYKANENAFPTAESYIQTANYWADYIKSRPGFSGQKIAVVGSIDNYPEEPRISRRNRWNTVVASNANSNIDAVALHWYLSTSLGNLAVNNQTAPLVLANTFSGYQNLKDELNEIRNAGKEAWFTEFNLYDKGHCLHQHFIHGLFTSAMALTLLQDPVVKHIDCHDIVGSSNKSSIFNDSLGLDLSGYTNDGVNCTPYPVPASNPRELTSQGNCLVLLAKAIQNAKTKRQLAFTGGPKLPGGYEALFGYQFDGPISTEMIILNLDSTDQTINIPSATWNLAQGKYISVYPGPGGVLDLIKGTAKLNPGQMECSTTGYLSAAQTMTLKAYSITRIFVSKNAIRAKATDNAICSGTTTSVHVKGGTNYQWSGTNLTEIKSDKSVMRFTAPIVSSPTNFVCTVTGQGGVKDSVTILVNPLPVVTAHADIDHVCKGSQIKLYATVNGANSNNVEVIWTPTSSLVNPDADTVYAYPYANTTYLCYATDGVCWARYDSVNVSVTPHADAGPDYTLCDDSLPYTLTAQNIDPLLTYEWYKNGILVGTGSSVAVSPSSATTYTLKVTTANSNGCVDSDQVTITPYTCCPSADYPTQLTFLPGQKLKTDLIPRLKAFCAANPGHGYCSNDTLRDFPDEIMFNGDFYADANFTFINCEKLKFGEKARIRFSNNVAKCKFVKCKLNAENCSNKMWGGFFMDDFNSRLTIDSCTITNAEIVVEGQRDPEIFITNTRFDRCYMGVYLHDNEQPFDGKFYGDTMSFSGSLKAPYSGMKPLCAFKLDNSPSVVIGDSTKPQNYFNNLQYGFMAINSDITCYNNKFENILQSDSTDGMNGTAIYMINPFGYGNINDPTQLWPEYALSAGADSTAYPNRFVNCKNGIYIENGDVNIRGNVFTGTKKAISLVGCMEKQIDVRYNNITGANTGFDALECKYSDINIYNNDITTNNQISGIDATPAIRIADVNGEYSTPTFRTNVIHSGGTHGIWIQNNHKITLVDNLVYMDNPNTSFATYGFRIENVDSLRTKCNLAKASSTASVANKTGMSFSFCPYNNMDCNTLDNAATGVEYLANCNNSIIRNNDFRYLDDGMVIGGVGLTEGVIGPQPVNPLSKPNNNKFYGQYIESVSGSGKYKGHFGHAATYAVNSQCSGTKGSSKQFFIFKGDSINIPYPNLSSGGIASALTPYYQVKPGSACIVSCNQPNPNKPVLFSGNFIKNDEVEEENLIHPELIISDVIPSVKEAATLYNLQSDLYSRLKNDESLLAGNADLQSTYEELRNSNIARFDNIESQIKLLNQREKNIDNFKTKLEELSQLNDEIIATNVVEKAEKQYNAIYFRSLKANGKLSENDLRMLKRIAHQCPYIAGTAVFKARSLYMRYEPSLNYNDNQLCTGKYQMSEQEVMQAKSQQLNVQLYPNPGNGYFNINYDLSGFTKGSIVFYNVLGNKVYETQLNTETDRGALQLSELAKGVYSYTVFGNSNPVAKGKITIIK